MIFVFSAGVPADHNPVPGGRCLCPTAGTGKTLRRRVVEGTAGTDVYPKDINGAVAEGLASLDGWEVVTASLNDPEQGLPDDLSTAPTC